MKKVNNLKLKFYCAIICGDFKFICRSKYKSYENGHLYGPFETIQEAKQYAVDNQKQRINTLIDSIEEILEIKSTRILGKKESEKV